MARSSPALKQPVNVKGAKRNHPRLQVVREARPIADYEIVHGTLVLPDPDHVATEADPFRLAYYYPGEVVRLDGKDAEQLLARGIIVANGDAPVLYHTMPNRDRSYYDEYKLAANGEKLRNPNPQPEGTAKLVHLDVDQAAERMYGADSSSDRLGSLNGSGR